MTNLIIEDFLKKGNKIICVTDKSLAVLNKKNENLKFINYKDLNKMSIDVKSTVFAWKDISKLEKSNINMKDWLESRNFSTKKSFFLSSASVYKNSEQIHKELAKNLEGNLEQNTKYLLEVFLTSIMHDKDINHLNLRISNVYGSKLDYGLVNSLLNSIREKTEIRIFSNREIVRDYINISDVIYAIQSLIESDDNDGDLNISTGIGTSIREIFEIFERCGSPVNNFISIKEPREIKLNSVLDCSSLSKLIYWNPLKLQDGVLKCLSTSIY